MVRRKHVTVPGTVVAFSIGKRASVGQMQRNWNLCAWLTEPERGMLSSNSWVVLQKGK